jgi:hypothetical protein
MLSSLLNPLALQDLSFPASYTGGTARIPSGLMFGIGEFFHGHICCPMQS